MIKMMNAYMRRDWEQLKWELKDAFRHADDLVYMYTRSYLEQLYQDQRAPGDFSLEAFILTYNNISRIMIDKGVFAEYTQVEMVLGALPTNLSAKVVMKLELDLWDPSKCKYNKLWKHIFDRCVTAEAHAHLDLEGASSAPGVSPGSVAAGVPLPQMPAVIIVPAIPRTVTPAPAAATKEIPVAKANNTIDMKIEIMMRACEAWTFQMSKVNAPAQGGYQTGRVYDIQADNPPLLTPTGPDYQQHPWQELGPCTYSDKLGNIHTFCPDVHTNQRMGSVHLNEHRRPTSGASGGNGGEISVYLPERSMLSMREYVQLGARQGEERKGVATSAAR